MIMRRLHKAQTENADAARIEMDATTLDALYGMIRELKHWKQRAKTQMNGMQLVRVDFDEIDDIIDSALNLKED